MYYRYQKLLEMEKEIDPRGDKHLPPEKICKSQSTTLSATSGTNVCLIFFCALRFAASDFWGTVILESY